MKNNLINIVIGALLILGIYLITPMINWCHAKTHVEVMVTVKSSYSTSKSDQFSESLKKVKVVSVSRNTKGGEALGGNSPAGSIETKIKKLFGKDAPVAIAVARCESGLREGAVGDGHIAYWQGGVEYGKSYGIFQIRHLPGRPDPTNLLQADFNIQYAYNLFKRSGFYPWSAYTNGCYQSFLAGNY